MRVPLRPTDSLIRVSNALKNSSEPIDVIPNKRLTWLQNGRPVIYLLIDGIFSIYRLVDGILLGTLHQPHVLGFEAMFHAINANAIKTETKCTIVKVPVDDAIKIIESADLWRDVAAILSYHTNMMVHRDLQLINKRTNIVVHYFLQEMHELNRDFNVNILKYIQDRTGLSRSSILNVIYDLKKEKIISYDRGGYGLKVLNMDAFNNYI